MNYYINIRLQKFDGKTRPSMRVYHIIHPLITRCPQQARAKILKIDIETDIVINAALVEDKVLWGVERAENPPYKICSNCLKWMRKEFESVHMLQKKPISVSN